MREITEKGPPFIEKVVWEEQGSRDLGGDLSELSWDKGWVPGAGAQRWSSLHCPRVSGRALRLAHCNVPLCVFTPHLVLCFGQEWPTWKSQECAAWCRVRSRGCREGLCQDVQVGTGQTAGGYLGTREGNDMNEKGPEPGLPSDANGSPVWVYFLSQISFWSGKPEAGVRSRTCVHYCWSKPRTCEQSQRRRKGKPRETLM